MAGRRERSWEWISETLELEASIRERFKSERYPEESVDGEDRWDRDPFEEEEE